MAARREQKSIRVSAGVDGVLDGLMRHLLTLALGGRIYQASLWMEYAMCKGVMTMKDSSHAFDGEVRLTTGPHGPSRRNLSSDRIVIVACSTWEQEISRD